MAVVAVRTSPKGASQAKTPSATQADQITTSSLLLRVNRMIFYRLPLSLSLSLSLSLTRGNALSTTFRDANTSIQQRYE